MIQARERRILYVDDTEAQRYAMRRILENAGYTVIEAGTGEDALRLLDPSILAVVLDVKLPDMSGYEVCRRIKANPATAGTPVLQVSASFADPTLRAAGLSGGADAYIAQPVHPAELLALVGALIRSHDASRTLRFQAETSNRLAATLDYEETVQAVEQAFIPRFADQVYLLLRAPGSHADSHTEPDETHWKLLRHQTAGIPPALERAALDVLRTGAVRLIPPAKDLSVPQAIAAPLQLGRKRVGVIVFAIHGTRRNYSEQNLPLAEDLAGRAALALQNASLFSAQRAAQLALIRSEKLAAAGRLSAAIAHEINNPLESITNLIYLIDTSPEITPTLKGYAQEALSELSRLTHIARQSLGFYREMSGPQRFDLNESVEDTLHIYLKRFEARHIHITRDYAPGPLPIVAVKGEIRQVVSNLLVNAYDALAEGGTLSLSTQVVPAAASDSPAIAGSPAMVALRIVDNGSGIPPETLAHIFEPFFTTKQGTGTGLGLWVSDTIVTNHGGSIEVTSQTQPPNRGTAFEVLLPAPTIP